MFKKVLLTVIVGFMTTTLSAFEADHLNRINLVNKTGAELWYIFISPGDSDWWGFDALGSDGVFEDGDVLSFNLLYPDYENYFDIMAIDGEGNTFLLYDTLISDEGEANVTLDATMFGEEKHNLLFAEINIENATDNEMQHIFVSSSDSAMWGIDFMGDGQTLGPYDTLTLLAPLEKDIASSYDIMATYDEYNEYTDSFNVYFDEYETENTYTHTIYTDYDDISSDSQFEASELNNISIVNNTGTQIEHVFISPGDSTVWGLDALGADMTFADQETLSFGILYSDYENYFDIMAVDGDGNAFILLDKLISDDEEATVILDASLLDEDKNDMKFAEVRIENPTNDDMLYVFISPSDSEMWGIDFMGTEQILEAHSTLSWVAPLGDDVFNYDVMVVDEDNEQFFGDFDIGISEFDEGSLYTYTIGTEIEEDEYVYDDSDIQTRPRSARPRVSSPYDFY